MRLDTATSGGRYATVAAVAGVIVFAAGAVFGAGDVLRGYLGAALALTSVPVGGIVLLYMMDVIGGAWRDVLGPYARGAAGLLPVTALAFVPVLLGILAGVWGGPPDPHWTPFKTFYLQPVFIALRAIGYFALWFYLRVPRGSVGSAAVALITLTLTVSLAGVDWAMAVDRDFSSSIYGLIFLAHVVLSGLAASIAWYGRTHDKPCPMLGALLIAVLLIWAYMHAMQFMIVWAGDRPDEIHWYIVRSTGLWSAVLWIVSFGGLVLPFAALLSPERRSSPRAAARIAVVVIFAMVLESFWLVMPGHVARLLLGVLGAIGGLLVCGGLAAMAAVRVPAFRAETAS